ncbi:MAG TPA: PQQ-binding-like beta-propeller repeat protein [Thermoguttaceae bacterium]|nr:PQQ-binding-like beta-propeller repeat protein [Thermoguttaceae bacterium]
MTNTLRRNRFIATTGRSCTRLHIARWAGLAAVLFTTTAAGEDWPTYRHDVARSGVTPEQVATPLFESWVFKARHAPEPAWGDPKPKPVENILELRRMHFDDAFQPVVADGAVYFGSSANNKVYCLDAATGAIRWTTITGGPVRLAPTVADGRVLVGSDDGYAYCLDAKDGSVRWKFHAAPEDRRVLGHGKMISLWPLRTGVSVDDGVAYFSAGIFPAEGVFLYAVDAATGREIWRNDTGGEEPQSRISPQGYLLASASNLYVPMGRVSPATYDRATGRLAAVSPFFGKTVGGTYALLAGEDVYTGTEEMVGYRATGRDRFASFPGRKMVVTDEVAYLATDTELIAMDRKNAKTVLWKLPCRCADSLILAGGVLLAGGDGEVVAVDADSGKQVWSGKVDGIAKGLAVADGRLLATTDKGAIHCFVPQARSWQAEITEAVQEDPFAGSASAAMFRKAAETILEETGVERGYCLVLGLETGELALELARRSELMIYAVSPDADKVAAARRKLDAAGVYGARVCVEQWPLEAVPYADYFANLIVSETAMVHGDLPGDADAVFRMLKPVGGKVMIGQPAKTADGVKPLGAAALEKWLAQSELPGGEILDRDGAWLEITRGPLPGAGSWTHQYANPGNTACGDDELVKAPFGVLWFGRPGPRDMVNRHSRAAGPLSLDGRLFIQGENTVMAYDAYNGLKLWQRDIPGAMRAPASHDSSNLALSPDGLFVAVEDKCLKLDPATGETKATYLVPAAPDEQPRRWAYVARIDNLLIGSRATRMNESECLFALDVDTGKHLWVHEASQIPHNAIVLGDGSLFLASSDATDEQRRKITEARRAEIQKLPEDQRAAAERELPAIDVRLVTALDQRTGKTRWQAPLDATQCGGFHGGKNDRSGILAAMYQDGVLVFFGVYLDGHYWNQFFAGQFDTRRITALSSKDGKLLWSQQIGFRVRPLIVGDTLHAEPWAYDLKTGEPRTRVHPITGETVPWQFSRVGHHCGLPCAAPHCMFFRSWNLAYYDLDGDYGSMHFGAQRPGCWINFIPAGGLLLVPEASAGCMCAFPNVCSIVFQPREQLEGWAMYSSVGETTPVRRLAINFGAPGDRQDAAGNLWLGFPRPFHGRLVMPLAIDVSCDRFVQRNSTYTQVAGTDDPWLFASAAVGLQKCEIPLLGKDDGTALYRVRLAFCDPENGEPGRRVFDVNLQGKTVLENFDIASAAGGKDRAVFQQFDEIEVADNLLIELVSKGDASQADRLPILQGVEVVRQRVLTMGCAVPEFQLSSMAPKQSGELKLSNLRDEPFEGMLRLTAPDGFEVEPKETKIRLASGERTALAIEAGVKEDVPAGEYEIGVQLVGADGTVALQRTIRIEHLGRRGRVVVPASEDTYVSQRYPDRNQGTATVMVVDGGDGKMADRDHSLAYLKFRIDVPGKPLSVRLRIHNAGNPTGDSGRVCLVEEPWDETKITYQARPAPGKELGRLGRVSENQAVECPLKVELKGTDELSLVIDPTSTDGTDYLTREADKPAELIVEYEPQ